MADALYSTDDYAAQIHALFPPGRAWPRGEGTIQDGVVQGLAPGLNRLDARAQALIVDAFPATTIELLPEWEAALGLPDPCDGDAQTTEQRQAAIVNKLVSAGGQSKAYFLGVLSRLGYPDATITEYAPFRADVSLAGDPLYSTDWIFHWTINLPEISVFYFLADVSTADTALFTVSDGAVFCVIAELQPSHTTVDYTFDP